MYHTVPWINKKQPEERNNFSLAILKELEVFREDIPRAAYVNSDRATAVSGCRQSIKSDECLRIVSKQLYTFSKSCLLAVEPSAFVKQPIKGWNHII